VATKTLVIDGTDRDHFFLSVESGTLRVGDAASHPEGVVRDMRIVRIHCEVEVDDDREFVPIDEPGVIAPSTLSPDSSVKLAHAQLSMASASAASTPATFAAPSAPAGDVFQLDLALSSPEGEVSQAQQPTTVIERRFKVIDGGDQGKAFKLPEEGTIKLGKPGHSDIGLHDFYVSKVHCLVHIDGYRILVSHVEGQSGTLIDGVRISVSQKLRTGSVLRIGNSHLKLEQGPFADDPDVKMVDYKPLEKQRPDPPPAPPPPPPPKRVVAMAVPEPKDTFQELEGQTFGHFKLSEIVGRGHAGAVFRAEDARSGETMAVKVLAAEFPAANAELEQFVREFKVVQGIRHENLIALHGAGKSGRHFWFTHDFVEGESAADVIRRIREGEKPSWTRSARVAVHLARALECLDENDLVHGNITPKNVLLAPKTHATKLADLRLVEALEGSKLQEAFAEKKRLADLPYAAPEQVDGAMDRLTDLYAVGAVSYALITGKPPASGETVEEIIENMKSKPPRPSESYKKVPEEFEKIVMKLLARKPERRYQTAAELLEDLEPISEAHDLKL